MKQLSWKFSIPAIVSVLLGVRELYLAWFLFYKANLIVQFAANEQVAKKAIFEVVFLVPGGLLLILWPILYRIQTVRCKK